MCYCGTRLRWLTLCAAIAAVCTYGDCGHAEESRHEHIRWVRSLRVNLRQKPSLNARIVNRLWKGTRVIPSDTSGDWVLVDVIEESPLMLWAETENRVGWIYHPLLSDTSISQVTESEMKRHVQRLRCGQAIQSHPEWSREFKQAIMDERVILGMTTEMVRLAWGEPLEVSRTVSALGISEKWIYGSSGPYLYFDNGVLTVYQE